jgi:hypothetical protein
MHSKLQSEKTNSRDYLGDLDVDAAKGKVAPVPQ